MLLFELVFELFEFALLYILLLASIGLLCLPLYKLCPIFMQKIF